MNIYVGNLPREATEDDLRELFKSFGEITSITIIKDRATGEPRGFGFIEMPTNTEAQSAIAGLNSRELKGQVIHVNEARSRTDVRGGRDRRSGGNRGGQRGSGPGGNRSRW
jgi:RNA recognition motif-containing protein